MQSLGTLDRTSTKSREQGGVANSLFLPSIITSQTVAV